MPTHNLKCLPEPFNALVSRVKTFEFRKDDRDPKFAVGDILVLGEYVFDDNKSLFFGE